MKYNFSLGQLIKLMRQGEISSFEIVKNYFSAIEAYNSKLNAYLTVNIKVLEIAKAIKNKPSDEKPLLGIPVAVKDIFVTKGLKTTAASKLLDDYIPQYSATAVKRLEDAGAIVLGKTNLDAWCHGSSTETSDYGPTKNPWNTDYLPGGSSGGSAAAVAANLAPCAVGTETAGSIRGPAAWCGIVGLKPTYGRVSRYGVIAMGSSLDSPGPLTKNVEDAAILLNILSGKDHFDATTHPLKSEDFLKKIAEGVNGLKIAIAENYLLPGMDSRVKDSVSNAAHIFEKLGAEVEFTKTLDPTLAILVYTIVQRSEVSSNLSRYDGVRYGGGREKFGNEAKRRIMTGTFSLSAGYQDEYYKKAQKVRTLFIEDFNKIFKKYDLLIGPTMPSSAPKIGVTKGKAMFGEMADVLTEPTSISGLPGISVPCGFVNGLPIGLDIIGPQFSESKILKAAYAYESEFNRGKEKPQILYE